MREGSQEDELDLPVEPAAEEEPAEGQYPVDRLRERLSQSLGNRPIMVYLVLIAGAATLILLLAIVWISATGGGPEDPPICTAISTSEAESAILSGQVERIKALVDRDEPLQTLTGIVLELTDGTCRQSAQGADARNDLYRLLGVVEHYNNFGEQRILVHYQRQEIQQELLSTSTPTATPTTPVVDTPTVEVTDTLVPTETFTPEPSATSTTSPTRTVQVGGGATSPPASSPESARTDTPEATVSATP